MLKLKQILKSAILCFAALSCVTLAARPEGGKKRIGVATFENGTEFEGLGNRLANMLVSGLQQNRNYELIERTQLNDVMEEQGLGLTGVLDPEEAAQIGKIAGLDYILLGAILEARADETSSKKSAVAGAVVGSVAGVALGIGAIAAGADPRDAGGITVGSAGAITDATSGQSYSTDFSILITVKVVEVETGRVLLTEDASAEDTRRWGKTQHVVSAEDFSRIGREAVRKVSNKIVWELDPLEPAVLLVEDEELIIDKGRKHGIRQGQYFAIVREGEAIRDLNGNLAGVKMIEIADIDILRAEETTAIGRILNINRDPLTKKKHEIKRGDLARIRFRDTEVAGEKQRKKKR